MTNEGIALSDFTNEMLARLKLCARDGQHSGWETMTLPHLYILLTEELNELRSALNDAVRYERIDDPGTNASDFERVAEEAVDVANFALFIFAHARKRKGGLK